MLGTPLGRILLDRPAWTYLLGPFFKASTPNAAAPLPATYREAGAVGALTVVQNDGQFSASGGLVQTTGQTTAVFGDLAMVGPVQTRLAGRALLVQLSKAGTTGWQAGWHTALPIAIAQLDSFGLLFRSSGQFTAQPIAIDFGAYVDGTAYQWSIVLRNTGSFVLARGGTYTNWTLFWVDSAGSTASLYPAVAMSAATGTLANLRVADLGGAWASDYGLATDRLVSPANNATATMTPDALVEETFVYSAGNLGGFLQYRRQDSANYFYVCALSGGGLYLGEVTASVETSRASAGGVFSDGVTYRIVVVIVGNVHTIYVNNVQKATYTDASNLRPTATGVLVPSSTPKPTEVVCWPRTVSLPAGV